MNYRLCEKCQKYAYSTGKDYEDFIGEFPLALMLKVVEYAKIETKGLCPFCNPTSIYNVKREYITHKDGSRDLITTDGKHYMSYGQKIPL